MQIENYADVAVQYYDDELDKLLLNYLSPEIDRNKNIKIYDSGCGDGSLVYAIINKFPDVASNFFASDLSEKRIEIVKKISDKIRATVDNVEEMKSISDNSIDFFISTQVIEHVDDKKMANSIDRVTHKDSIIYLTTVFKKWYGWYFYRNNGKWVLDPTHLREYAKDEQLLQYFNDSKFEILENKKKLQWFPVIHFILKLFKVKDRTIYKNNFIRFLKNIKIPILGYYEWILVFKKK